MDVFIQMYNRLNDNEKNNIFNLVNNDVAIVSPTDREREFLNIYENVDSSTKEQIKNGFNILHNTSSSDTSNDTNIMSLLNNIINQSGIGKNLGELEIVTDTLSKARKFDNNYKERKDEFFTRSNLFILSAILII